MSIKEVAARAGVSVGTVSNVLNRPHAVSAANRERVQQAIDDLGFVRNESARQLRAGRSRFLAAVVLDVANPFFTDVARGAQEAADAAGLVLLLCSSHEDVERERRHLEVLGEQRVTGILLSPVDSSPERLTELLTNRSPVVLVDSQDPGRQTCSVAVDDVHGGRLAVRHLLDAGHRRIAFIGGPNRLQQVRDRLEGARAAVAELEEDAAALTVLETEGLTVEEGRRAGARIAQLPARSRPTAAFCANDLVALGVLQDATARGVRVPQDLALVGYDDIDFAAAAAVPLTSVRQPRHLLGRTAAELLLAEAGASTAHEHQQVVFQPDLVVRLSSRHRRPRR
ncbi:LacI family transcriptional regulator [Kineococcus xinjiangensis]|uniref:LacI family transcriptional regulator n=1 Tax=Kineococcus xinjiangensis TaxID=512762 RepID=A0A2S6IGX6_9ACTN|nr:LacI family transcriptional regulator [Kineococcus xinjiangensis]